MGPDGITTDWLSNVLDADVTGLRHQRIGDGLVGLNLRVDIDYADSGSSTATSASGRPVSVVIKLPSLDTTSRAAGVMLRNYEREVKFYDAIADTVDIRVPRCHHGSWDSDTGDFVLVLEDMAPAAQGDQVAGCGLEHARDAVLELAKLHGPRWGDESLNEHEFLGRRNGSEDIDQLVGLWTMFLPGFLDAYTSVLTPEGLTLLGVFGDHLGEWIEGRTGPSTVTHGDYRLDNLLFATPEGGPAVTAVDWQTPGHGPAVADLAYFCGAGLVPEERREHETMLLGEYAVALTGYGVDVDSDWLWTHYRREAFAGVVMAVVASQVVGSTERSEAMFGAMASRHVQHCLDLDSLDAIR